MIQLHVVDKQVETFDYDESNEYPLWIFHPHEMIRVRWDMFMMVILAYLVFDIPLKICFEIDLPLNDPWAAFDEVVNITFWVDIIFNFNTGFIEGLRFVTSRTRIAAKYAKGWLLLDVITSIPVDLFIRVIKRNAAHNIGTVSKVLRIFRIMRLLKLLRILRLLKMVSQWTVVNYFGVIASKMLKLLMMLMLIAHTAACFFVGIQNYYRAKDHSWENYRGYNPNSWFVRFSSNSPTWEKNRSEQYLRALYWAFTTLTTIGYGDITPVLPLELFITVVFEVIASTYFGYLIGNVASVVTHADSTVVMIENKIRVVKDFITYRQIPDGLRERIQNHYGHAWKHFQVYKEGEILAELPHSLRTDSSLHIHRKLVREVPFLSSLESGILPSLVVFLKPALATPGEIVLREGQIGTEMFFISSGKLTIELAFIVPQSKHIKNSIVIEHLKNGQAFAEYAIMMDQARHPASVVSQSHCDMFVLSRNDFVLFEHECPVTFSDLLRKCKEEYIQLTNMIIKKKRSHLLQWMAFQQGHVSLFEERRESTEPDGSMEFQPGVVVDFWKRLAFHCHQNEIKQREMGQTYPVSQGFWSLQLLDRMLLLQKFAKHVSSPKKSTSHHTGLNCSKEEASSEQTTLHGFLPGENIAYWIVTKMHVLGLRAKQRVAIRNIEAEQKRHCNQFNLNQDRMLSAVKSRQKFGIATKRDLNFIAATFRQKCNAIKEQLAAQHQRRAQEAKKLPHFVAMPKRPTCLLFPNPKLAI